ncbi:MAG: transcriptional regulator [Terracidiphilus sp.]|nr:transcriptional regulator [Terracidiphilus sp.]MDR3797458.1 transcriptional regulator [Terracidiphilus sp.]
MNRLLFFSLKLRQLGIPVQLVFIFLCLFCFPALHAQGAFTVVGPDGGDARAFASVPGQPNHLYLGTTNSWLYESLDEGATWRRLAKLDRGDGFVIDSIVVDSAHPSTLFVGAWKNTDDGGLWISHDAGRTWHETAFFKGQPIYALTQAPSDPHMLFAGTLQGVYRSSDSGATWTQISPPGSHEIHEIESLAVDPADPGTVYAGTWHLPWKTTDGGKTWRNIKEGLIVDSDVFSIIVDPEHPHIVYLSACSGIYKSENAGTLFHKIQGIPTEARRTRVLMQDPENRQIVYAGTTEGLYKTVNGGKTFTLMTSSDVVINDVYVDPGNSNRVLLATDRGGVLTSNDAGVTFTPSNLGISERKITALLVDRNDPTHFYAGVVNDKQFGGVFRSVDAGAHWEQLGAGLDGRDVFALAETKDGAIVAGTSHGIFVLGAPADPPATAGDPAPAGPSAGALIWQPRNAIANTLFKTATEVHRGTKVNIEKQVKAPVVQFESLVNALDVSGDVWVAASHYGLLTSQDQGATWQGGPVMGSGDYLSVTAHANDMVAARDDSVVISSDAGKSWFPMGMPTVLTHIHRVVFLPDGTLWLGAREGVFFTRNLGKTWLWINRLPLRDIDDLSYDSDSKRVLVSSRTGDEIYAIDPKTMTWVWWPTGYQIALIRVAGDRLVAASLDDGVLVGPKVPPAPNPPVDAPALPPPSGK